MALLRVAAYVDGVRPYVSVDEFISTIPHQVLPNEGTHAVWLEGPQRFEEEVVGESYCQVHLSRITGGAAFRRDPMRAGAWLSAELDNPHDPNAIMVWIRAGKVGYLPRPRAAIWQPVLMAFWRRYGLFPACHAEIRGGWQLREPDDRGNTRAYYGVRLYLPISL